MASIAAHTVSVAAHIEDATAYTATVTTHMASVTVHTATVTARMAPVTIKPPFEPTGTVHEKMAKIFDFGLIGPGILRPGKDSSGYLRTPLDTSVLFCSFFYPSLRRNLGFYYFSPSSFFSVV